MREKVSSACAAVDEMAKVRSISGTLEPNRREKGQDSLIGKTYYFFFIKFMIIIILINIVIIIFIVHLYPRFDAKAWLPFTEKGHHHDIIIIIIILSHLSKHVS
jgi:hypothetical protein